MLGTEFQFISLSDHSLVTKMGKLYQPVRVGTVSTKTQNGLQENVETWTWIHVVKMQSSNFPEIHSDGMHL